MCHHRRPTARATRRHGRSQHLPHRSQVVVVDDKRFVEGTGLAEAADRDRQAERQVHHDPPGERGQGQWRPAVVGRSIVRVHGVEKGAENQ